MEWTGAPFRSLFSRLLTSSHALSMEMTTPEVSDIRKDTMCEFRSPFNADGSPLVRSKMRVSRLLCRCTRSHFMDSESASTWKGSYE